MDVPDEILAEDIDLMVDLAGRSDQVLFPGAAPQISRKNISAPVKLAVTADPWTIVPGVRVGPITNRTSEAEIRALYGAEKVRRQSIPGEEGEIFPGTVVYPDDPEKAFIIRWRDPYFRNLPESVIFRGSRSAWKTDKGLTLGLTLKDTAAALG